jgi:hypothetical protein
MLIAFEGDVCAGFGAGRQSNEFRVRLLEPAAVANRKAREAGLGKRDEEGRIVLAAHAASWDRIKRMDGQASCDGPRGWLLGRGKSATRREMRMKAWGRLQLIGSLASDVAACLLERGESLDLTFLRGRLPCREGSQKEKPGGPWSSGWSAGGEVACSPHCQSNLLSGRLVLGPLRLAAAFHQGRATTPVQGASQGVEEPSSSQECLQIRQQLGSARGTWAKV